MFYITVFFYFASIISTLVGMKLMKTAQPALLYIVPALSLAFMTIGYVFGYVKEMLEYEDDQVAKEAGALEGKETELKEDAKKTGTDKGERESLLQERKKE